MIEVGLTAVGEHPSLAADGKVSTLADLAGVFPTVELDTSFYGVPSVATVQKWQAQVPEAFQFIVKATANLTTHPGSDRTKAVADASALRGALLPLVAQHQLTAILLQFPPYFGVNATNVRYLRWVRTALADLPLAVEWRNASWLTPAYRDTTVSLLRELTMSYVAVDEPQTPSGSVPLVQVVTNPALAVMRLHGRNVAGWQQSQGAGWRERRTNYRYSAAELAALGEVAKRLAAKRVSVIFNNNGGRDAADNAVQFIEQEHLTYPHLGPKQLKLF